MPMDFEMYGTPPQSPRVEYLLAGNNSDAVIEYSAFRNSSKRKLQEEPPPPESTEPLKQPKQDHRCFTTKDLAGATRYVLVQFNEDKTQLVEAKIVFREPWGVMVTITESNPFLAEVEKGSRWWAKWTGRICPIVSVPVVEAIHAFV